MPVFFYISGMSSIFFNFDKKFPFWRYFTGKIRRLVFPLIFGIFFVLMPQYYVMQDWCSWGRLDDGLNTEHNYFKFVIR